LLAIALHWLPHEAQTRARDWFFARPVVLQGAALAAYVLVLVALAAEARPFVYFQF
jgi:uncharacterized heparinase superfamily protein